MMKVGNVFYTNRKDSEWKIWHEIMKIDGDMITLTNYGKDMKAETVKIRKREFSYCIRKGLLIPA